MRNTNDPKYYLLSGHNIVPCDSLKQWATNSFSQNRRVRLTRIGPFEISTVFLGLDHNFSSHGPPLVFETMTSLTPPPLVAVTLGT